MKGSALKLVTAGSIHIGWHDVLKAYIYQYNNMFVLLNTHVLWVQLKVFLHWNDKPQEV